jgi:hypothetical protein
VYHYHNTHKQQLVSVALSRVTSLEGLFLAKATNDFTFYHAHGTSAPSIKEVHEYLRLANHRLRTFTMDIKRLLDVATSDLDSRPAVVIVNVNAQSLTAHAEDISNDALLLHDDLLAISETWIDAAAPVTINNFQLVHQLPCERRTRGVAVYKRNAFTYAAMPLHIELTASYQTKLRAMSHVGDVIVTQVNLPDESKFTLAAVYVHQRITYNDLAMFLTSWKLQYSDLIEYLGLKGD